MYESDTERKVYCELWVMSMLTMSFHVHGQDLGLGYVFPKLYSQYMVLVTFLIWVCWKGDSEIELQCYSETWVMSIYMLRSVLSVKTRVRFHCVGRFTGLIQFRVQLWSGCDGRVSMRLCLRIRIRWTDTKM